VGENATVARSLPEQNIEVLLVVQEVHMKLRKSYHQNEHNELYKTNALRSDEYEEEMHNG
jgi:hypothetical protein